MSRAATFTVMRKYFKKFLPGHEAVHSNRWLRMFGGTLLHPRLWHLNRHSAAGAVAVGLFCGLIPGPLQMLGAAICAILFRINLPLALVVTLYTNPLTIVPLYFIAFELGKAALGNGADGFVPPPDLDWQHLHAWVGATLDWALGLGKPLGVGLLLLAAILATSGYFAVHYLWRLWLIQQWRRRARQRGTQAGQPRP